MSAENPGGPAFPRAQCPAGDGIDRDPGAEGMNLRDWFAGMALTGMIAESQGLEITTEQFAKQAFKLADAMLKERNK